MALSPRITSAVANAMINVVGTNVNGGTIKLYDGTQPTNGGDAVTTQNLIATLPLGSPAYGSPTAGVITANPIGPAIAVFTGTATWFRLADSSGVTYMDGSVGTSGCDLNLNSVSIASGDTLAVTSSTITQPKL